MKKNFYSVEEYVIGIESVTNKTLFESLLRDENKKLGSNFEYLHLTNNSEKEKALIASLDVDKNNISIDKLYYTNDGYYYGKIYRYKGELHTLSVPHKMAIIDGAGVRIRTF